MIYFIDFMTLWRVIFPNAFALPGQTQGKRIGAVEKSLDSV